MPRKTLIVLAVSVTVLLVAAAGVFAYDQTQKDTIAEGVTVGGVDVGGQTEAEARATLEREIVAPLRRTLVVRAGDRTFRLSAREAKTTVNVDATVEQALAASRDGNPVVRTWRSVTGGELDTSLTPQIDYSHDSVSRLIDRVRVKTQVKARNAKVDFAATTVAVQSARTGKAVNTQNLRDAVKLALADPSQPREVKATMRKIKPKIGDAQLAKKYPVILTVDRPNFKLHIFKNLKLQKTYPIALGQAGMDTPSGLYDIANKAVNPAWHVPNSAWAGDLAGTVVPPGPSNPIKARWLGIYDGVGIHGTDARGSIGTNASHGCIRMLVEDVTDLYDRVPVGAPIYIS
ncbi:MAG: L,D-transpeptidase family protein [Baekduiaceae bacterium]